MSIILLVLGFLLLIKSADWLVDSASSIGRMLGIPGFIMGVTVIAFGTSAPELVIGILSGMKQNNLITLGAVVGSSIANIGFVIGTISILYPLIVEKNALTKEIPISFFVQCLLLLLLNVGGVISRIDGIILLVLFFIFLYYIFFTRVKITEPDPIPFGLNTSIKSISKRVIVLLLSFVGVSYGGNLVVDSATTIAQILGMSELLIGTTVVAIGTSLPELVTSINALSKGKKDISIGSIIGSNIFNILFVLGVSTVIHPIQISEDINFDILVTILLTGLTFLLALRHKRIPIYGGILLLAIYIAYIVSKILII